MPSPSAPYGVIMTAPVLTRYPLDAAATRRRRRRIAVVVAVRREQSHGRRVQPSPLGTHRGGPLHVR